tara:strand:- start:33 stop:221 length:189 start_codon:yes stop_codon:yes gene_type:complete
LLRGLFFPSNERGHPPLERFIIVSLYQFIVVVAIVRYVTHIVQRLFIAGDEVALHAGKRDAL